jgi:superfamily II DNA helicase RecQ
MKKKFEKTPVLALTATATASVKEDVVCKLLVLWTALFSGKALIAPTYG